MKNSLMLSRAGRAALCAALAAALLCGCAALPARQTETPLPEEEQLYNSSLLDDGTLRLFYSDIGGTTVLCGGEVLYQGSATDTVTLVQDDITGETNYYKVSCNREDGSRTSLLYDRTGALVYDCGDNNVVSLVNGKLILWNYSGYDVAMNQNFDYYIMDLATGEIQPMPVAANQWFTDGAGYFFAVTYNKTEVTADAGWTGYNQMCYDSTTIVYDKDLQEVARLEHCRGTQVYSSFSDNRAGWVALEFGTDGGEESSLQTKLYCQATGEMIDDYVYFCGDGLICTGTEETGYQVRRLRSYREQRLGSSQEVLGEYDAPCELYLPELILTWRSSSGPGNYGYYAIFADDPDHEQRARFDYNGSTIALLFEDGELWVYDRDQQDEPVLRIATEQPQGTYGAALRAIAGGYVVIEYYDNEYNTLRIRCYGPDGLLCDVAGEQYDSFYYLTKGENGPLFAAGYDGPGGASLTNVIDAQGNVLYEGLKYAYQAYDVPEGIFRARRGFLTGWMTASGEWAYCESIFRTLSAEDRISYIW